MDKHRPPPSFACPAPPNNRQNPCPAENPPKLLPADIPPLRPALRQSTAAGSSPPPAPPAYPKARSRWCRPAKPSGRPSIADSRKPYHRPKSAPSSCSGQMSAPGRWLHQGRKSARRRSTKPGQGLALCPAANRRSA